MSDLGIAEQTSRVVSADEPGADHGLSQWNFSLGKRLFDLTGAAVSLTLTLPLMAIIAVAVRLSSPGPALFRQRRVGRNGKLFEIMKFRTMFVRKQNPGLGLTRDRDSRITPIGRILRKSKLDELPQLFNVLTGEMSLVGPRPDLPEYYETLSPEHALILALQPGITGWATLHFRNEEELLASVPDEQLTRYYVDEVLPAKADLALDYARKATFLGDLSIVVRTAIGA